MGFYVHFIHYQLTLRTGADTIVQNTDETMALISDIVKELALSTATAEKSVTVIARWLREDGLLSQKGRGRGAAQATPLDAARLLIALMVGGKIRNAPQAVRDYGQLVHSGHLPGAGDKRLSLENLCGLPDGHTFEEGLAALIGIWGNEGAMRTVRKQREVLGSKRDPFSATVFDFPVSGSIHTGDLVSKYEHPFMRRPKTGTPEQLTLDASSEEEALSAAVLDDELAASWEKVRDRYQSGIRSYRIARATLLRSLGEVVADLRERGSGSQQDRKSSALLDVKISDG